MPNWKIILGVGAGVIASCSLLYFLSGKSRNNQQRRVSFNVNTGQVPVVPTGESSRDLTLSSLVDSVETNNAVPLAAPYGSVVCSDIYGREVDMRRIWSSDDFRYDTIKVLPGRIYSCTAAVTGSSILEEGLKLERKIENGSEINYHALGNYVFDAEKGVFLFRVPEGNYRISFKIDGGNGVKYTKRFDVAALPRNNELKKQIGTEEQDYHFLRGSGAFSENQAEESI